MLVICNDCFCSVCVFLLTLSSSCFYSFSLCQHTHTQARQVVSMCVCALVHVLVICNCCDDEYILTLSHAYSSIYYFTNARTLSLSHTHTHTFSQQTAKEKHKRYDEAQQRRQNGNPTPDDTSRLDNEVQRSKYLVFFCFPCW